MASQAFPLPVGGEKGGAQQQKYGESEREQGKRQAENTPPDLHTQVSVPWGLTGGALKQKHLWGTNQEGVCVGGGSQRRISQGALCLKRK